MKENSKGWPALTIRNKKNSDGTYDENFNHTLKNYLLNWHCKTESFAGRIGIRAYIPDWIDQIDNDSCCPKFNSQQIDFISNKIESEKIIPVLNYAPNEFLLNTKNVWWIVPFCIWADNRASWIFIDKNGFYAAHPEDNDISMIFSWDGLEDIEFLNEDWHTDESEVKTLNLTHKSGYLSLVELVENGRGSYLSVINNIYEIRKTTIDKSKGENTWAEGAGGEGFKGFERPQDLLITENWEEPDRPNPLMFGFSLEEDNPIENETEEDEKLKPQDLENQIQLISFTMIFMEFLDYTEKKSIDDLHQLMKHKICHSDWELFTNCWAPGLEQFDSLKEGIETYEEAFVKIENLLKNSDSYSEKQRIEFIDLCVELYKTSTGQIDFDGDEMKNKFELNGAHTHYNKLKFFKNLNEGFGKNMVYEKLFELVAVNKKIQFFTHIIKGNLSDSNICFTKGIGGEEYMSKFKHFEDCFEESSQVMSLNYLDALGREALDFVMNQIQKLRKENVSFFIQLGLVDEQKPIIVFDDLIPRRNKLKGSRLNINSDFFISSLIESFKKEFLKSIEKHDDYLCDFSIVDNIEFLCEPNFSKIEEVDLQSRLKVFISGSGAELNQGFISKNDYEAWINYKEAETKTPSNPQKNLWNQFCIDHLDKEGYWEISDVTAFTALDHDHAFIEIYLDENLFFSGKISELTFKHFNDDEIENSKNVSKDYGNSFLPEQWDDFFTEESFNAREKKLVTTQTVENFELNGEIDFKPSFDIKKFGLIQISTDEMGYGIDYGDYIIGFTYDDIDFYFEFPGGFGQFDSLKIS